MNKADELVDSHGLPEEIMNFLYAKNSQGRSVRNVSAIRLTLGPYNESFFVHDSASYIWMNLPSNLLTALQARIQDGSWIDRPRLVALGADANFVLITEKQTAIWRLNSYTKMAHMLEYSRSQARGIAAVRNISLHAYRYQCFVTQSANGTLISENIPPHEIAGVESIRIAILNDHKDIERRVREKEVVRRRLESVAKRPSLQHQATLRNDFGDKKQEFHAKARGLRVSLSLSISAAGIRLV